MNACIMCGRPFKWQAEGEKGIVQGWYRHAELTRKGPRCADRDACKNATVLAPTLFDEAH